jgi:hypothetical protein
VPSGPGDDRLLKRGSALEPRAAGGAALWRYVKGAFWRSPEVPGLGRVPVNVAGVIGLLILGFAQPAFWLLGAAAEVAYLVLSATNPRFQKLMQVHERQAAAAEDSERQDALLHSLTSESRSRLRRLEESCDRLARLAVAHDVAESIEVKRKSIQRLAWLFLKLLVALDHLKSGEAAGDAGQLEAERAELERELARPDLSGTLRRSKEATLRILEQRLVNVGRHAQAMAEVTSDLKRIEEQVRLALEEARLKGDIAISLDIDLESELIEDSFGAAGAHVVALDRRFQPASRPPQKR